MTIESVEYRASINVGLNPGERLSTDQYKNLWNEFTSQVGIGRGGSALEGDTAHLAWYGSSEKEAYDILRQSRDYAVSHGYFVREGRILMIGEEES